MEFPLVEEQLSWSLLRYSAWTGLWLCSTLMASSTVNHSRLRPMLTESSQASSVSVTVNTYTYVLCFRSWFCSNTPSRRPSLPFTPASSNTSRTAAPHGSSSGSIPPPGTIHWSGCRLLLTSRTSSSRSFLKQRHAARFLKPSPSYVLVWFGLSFILGVYRLLGKGGTGKNRSPTS